MSKNTRNFLTIATHRMLAEERIAHLLQDADSFITLDKVKNLIFEAEPADNRSYLIAMLSAVNCDVADIDDASLQVIQDAWNYFPHRFLNSRCPAEIMMEKTRNI
jgi:hypothetical protein